MSLTATRWAHEQMLPTYEKLALLILADMARWTKDGWVCWPSMETIATRGGMCQGRAREAIRTLEGEDGKGLIRSERRPGRSTRYTLAAPPPPQKVAPRAEGERHHDARRAPPRRAEPTKEPITEPAAGAADVWVAYWRRRIGEGLDGAGRERLASLIRTQSREAWEAIERADALDAAPDRPVIRPRAEHARLADSLRSLESGTASATPPACRHGRRHRRAACSADRASAEAAAAAYPREIGHFGA